MYVFEISSWNEDLLARLLFRPFADGYPQCWSIPNPNISSSRLGRGSPRRVTQNKLPNGPCPSSAEWLRGIWPGPGADFDVKLQVKSRYLLEHVGNCGTCGVDMIYLTAINNPYMCRIYEHWLWFLALSPQIAGAWVPKPLGRLSPFFNAHREWVENGDT